MSSVERLFLFDIDGTLLRAGTAVHRESFRYAYRSVYGLPLSLDGVTAAGRTDTWLLAEPLRRHGMDDTEIWAHMSEAFGVMEAYVEKNLGDLRSCVLPGVPDVLEGLDMHGRLLGLLTGNLSGIARAKLRHAGLNHFFEAGGFGEESEIRSHLVPVALADAARSTGYPILPFHAAVVGDTPLDVEAGKASGTKTAGVATGPSTYAALAQSGADIVFPSFENPKAVITSLLGLFD